MPSLAPMSKPPESALPEPQVRTLEDLAEGRLGPGRVTAIEYRGHVIWTPDEGELPPGEASRRTAEVDQQLDAADPPAAYVPRRRI